MKSICLCLILIMQMFGESRASGCYPTQGPENIIPVPAEVTVNRGIYRFENDDYNLECDTLLQGSMPPESYRLTVDRRGIRLEASDDAGFLYGMVTLDQMIPDGEGVKQVRCCEIYDYPQFPYRGIHVDVSRHFRGVDFLMKQISAMKRFKMNRMHIHLTDAAGWRLQIDAYPRLTQFAAWRPYASWKDWWAGDRSYAEEGTTGAYGGYYTKEDIRRLVSYARQYNVEIIPEIELPGHSEEVLAAYPSLSCSGLPYTQGEFCVGNEETFVFLETVLSEVMELFPSEYIHIGGDEANKEHWKTCPKCQQRIEDEGLEDVDELQSYMIKRIAGFVQSKGKKVIGWDEILDGGLAEDATVMSWRGTEGGISAMNMGHDVIMTPGRYCYLDHTQDAPFKEPQSIGGYLPLDSVYMYNPVEDVMQEDKLHHLLGLQANLWSEYVETDGHAEYMYWPRAIAIAETAWSRPEKKNLQDFRRRVLLALKKMKEDGYNVFDLESEFGERELARNGLRHIAQGCEVTYHRPVQQWYPAAGEATFTDGIFGGWTYSDGKWQGFLSDIDVTIDLQDKKEVSYIGGTFMQLKGPGVFMPSKVDILVSENGVDFRLVQTIDNDVSTDAEELLFKSFEVECSECVRYIRYHAYRSSMRGFLFLDEIVVL